MTSDTASGLSYSDTLWKSADTLRGQVDAAEYKHVVPGLLFLDYISNSFQPRRDELPADLTKDGIQPDQSDRLLESRAEYTAERVVRVPPESCRPNLQNQATRPDIATLIDDAILAIGRDNPNLKSRLPRNDARRGLEPVTMKGLIDLIAGIEFKGSRDKARDTLGRANEHFVNIDSEAELPPEATFRRSRIDQREGTRDVSRNVEHYLLDAVLAVGYRVRSARGTASPQWATARLSELLVKGFKMEDERLKAGCTLGVNYFDRFLARIRDIRPSEQLLYQRSPISTPRASTTTRPTKPPDSSSRPCRTRCTGPHMADWIAGLDDFLKLSDRDPLTHAALPQPVDQHFQDAIDELKKIEVEVKKTPNVGRSRTNDAPPANQSATAVGAH